MPLARWKWGRKAEKIPALKDPGSEPPELSGMEEELSLAKGRATGWQGSRTIETPGAALQGARVRGQSWGPRALGVSPGPSWLSSHVPFILQ